jgi:hypothetical protein
MPRSPIGRSESIHPVLNSAWKKVIRASVLTLAGPGRAEWKGRCVFVEAQWRSPRATAQLALRVDEGRYVRAILPMSAPGT